MWIVRTRDGWVDSRGFSTPDRGHAHKWRDERHARAEAKRFIDSVVERA